MTSDRLVAMGISWQHTDSAWMHVLALRVFVETVLRYGLPLNFVAGIVKVCISPAIARFAIVTTSRRPILTKTQQTDPKRGKKAKASLDARFGDLGGNALSRDKNGKPTKDDATMQQDLAGAGFSNDQGFEAYVFYEFEIV